MKLVPRWISKDILVNYQEHDQDDKFRLRMSLIWGALGYIIVGVLAFPVPLWIHNMAEALLWVFLMPMAFFGLLLGLLAAVFWWTPNATLIRNGHEKSLNGMKWYRTSFLVGELGLMALMFYAGLQAPTYVFLAGFVGLELGWIYLYHRRQRLVMAKLAFNADE